jgi:hypothetical protein
MLATGNWQYKEHFLFERYSYHSHTPVILSVARRSRAESKDPIALTAELNLESISSTDQRRVN